GSPPPCRAGWSPWQRSRPSTMFCCWSAPGWPTVPGRSVWWGSRCSSRRSHSRCPTWPSPRAASSPSTSSVAGWWPPDRFGRARVAGLPSSLTGADRRPRDSRSDPGGCNTGSVRFEGSEVWPMSPEDVQTDDLDPLAPVIYGDEPVEETLEEDAADGGVSDSDGIVRVWLEDGRLSKVRVSPTWYT